MSEMNAAEIANEISRNIGHDFILADALDPEFLDTEAEEVDARWEREGRREMYDTLFGDAFNG